MMNRRRDNEWRNHIEVENKWREKRKKFVNKIFKIWIKKEFEEAKSEINLDRTEK
jgi:hypothetical protein